MTEENQNGEWLWREADLVCGPYALPPRPPDKFYPDGKPILDDELLPAFMKWAMLFEDTEARSVGQTKTLYGEHLSTVWLGLDHSFGHGPPLIYETMLFAPRNDRRRLNSLTGETPEQREAREIEDKYVAKHYPHDQLQLRYSTRERAEDAHAQLKLHCLIPPRWRSFLLGTIGGHNIWKRDEEEDAWN